MNSDEDLCDLDEIEATFNQSYQLLASLANEKENKYILHVEANRLGNEYNIAVATSNDEVEFYALNNTNLIKLTNSEIIASKESKCIGLGKQDANLFYIAYTNAIKLYDMRVGEVTTQFSQTSKTSENETKRQTCFDSSTNNYLLASGTELHEGDAYILFWDVRKTKLLGAYWESHNDAITQVKFHPADVNRLISASLDGLINLYNIEETNEDEALLDTFNIETAVEHTKWLFNRATNDYCICSTSDTFEVRLWNCNDTLPFIHLKREELGECLKRKSHAHCYIADYFNTKSNKEIMLLLGSNYANGGECLRSFKVETATTTAAKKFLQPTHNFKENKQVVRATWFDPHDNLLLTGGERNILNAWRIDVVS